MCFQKLGKFRVVYYLFAYLIWCEKHLLKMFNMKDQNKIFVLGAKGLLYATKIQKVVIFDNFF